MDMNRVKLLDVVVALSDMPDEGIRTGMKGTVIDIHEEPCLAYEIEFCDESGRTIAVVALLPDQVNPVWSRD
ncbi:DUF4926 domain-containing protein [Cupriavidus sp. MP-37]|uniref:DUF4926 domain-containing protein n=1 Tax=Cupriavidus sp. MP-37 TaxID=2884455 RepID=UPI001D0A519D|nr:DUF4926 domain-containing protein [Cupriavidus sp. MP-37]UDM53961.1 DUF4926 domain-containing protein [Cupriavidus sp. MP-37]